MNKTACLKQKQGFTLIEFTLSLAILAIFVGLSTPYLFGVKEKTLLELERDKIVNSLKMAQQNAIAAQGGQDYQIEFDLTRGRYVLNPESKIYNLPPNIEFISITPGTSLTFYKLTGTPSASLNLIIGSKRYKSEVQIDSLGVISSTNPEKRT